jgi:hydroxymethylpyrimidine pyrophosphatase-like HAD family hydrolase
VRGFEGGVSVSLTNTRRDFRWSITDKSATKGRALEWRARQLGIDRSQVMAIGDNFNDLEMLDYAGLPVVMENAVPELLVRGWATTGHQDAAGAAEAIRRHALRER